MENKICGLKNNKDGLYNSISVKLHDNLLRIYGNQNISLFGSIRKTSYINNSSNVDTFTRSSNLSPILNSTHF